MHETVQQWLTELHNGTESPTNLYHTFLERLVHNFRISTITKDGVPIYVCDRQVLDEFYQQGVEILRYLCQNRNEFFDYKNVELIGVEVPLEVPLRENLTFTAYLDIVTRSKITGQVKIYDLKTSTRGWNKWQKEDTKKTNQLLLYKHFYAQQHNISPDYINIEFVILKRETDNYTPRITRFQPDHTKLAIQRTLASFNEFINECFDEVGNYKVTDIKAVPSKNNCRFCQFNNNAALCSKSHYLERTSV